VCLLGLLRAAPEITEGPVDVTEFVDSRLMLACAARGDPRPTVQWQKRNGTGGRWMLVSRTSERYKIQRSGNLVIRRLLASDAGLFRCVAENAVGSAFSAAATLVVQGLGLSVISSYYARSNARSVFSSVLYALFRHGFCFDCHDFIGALFLVCGAICRIWYLGHVYRFQGRKMKVKVSKGRYSKQTRE